MKEWRAKPGKVLSPQIKFAAGSRGAIEEVSQKIFDRAVPLRRLVSEANPPRACMFQKLLHGLKFDLTRERAAAHDPDIDDAIVAFPMSADDRNFPQRAESVFVGDIRQKSARAVHHELPVQFRI